MPYSGTGEELLRKQREQMRAWRAANAERDRESLRSWRAANPEKVAMQQQRQRAKEAGMRDEINARRRAEYDSEKMSAYRRDYYARNRERILAHKKAKYLADGERERERQVAYGALRRARKRGSGVVETIDRAAIIARDKSRCHLCGKRVPKAQIHLDHIVPLAAGGEHTARNLAVAHSSCNTRKGARAANDQLRLVG